MHQDATQRALMLLRVAFIHTLKVVVLLMDFQLMLKVMVP
jgi:hypothetical protein